MCRATCRPRAGNIRAALPPLDDPAVDIATLAARDPQRTRTYHPSVVKAVGSPIGPTRLRALYFTRATAPYGDGPRYHHIGLYAYRRAALERFVALPPVAAGAAREARAAPRAGSRHADRRRHRRRVPLGVDTPADLETARAATGKSLSG